MGSAVNKMSIIKFQHMKESFRKAGTFLFFVLAFAVCGCSSDNNKKSSEKNEAATEEMTISKGLHVSHVDSLVTGTWDKKFPPNLIITASGVFSESCWENGRLIKKEGGKFGPEIFELDMVGDRPDGICTQQIKPFGPVSFTIENVDQSDFQQVIIYSANNSAIYTTIKK